MTIPVVDIFAGPGGLGEGFESYRKNRNRKFRIALSIEKDEYAHRTLLLRSFFRQFAGGAVPDEYYQHLRGEISLDELFYYYKNEAASAGQEAWKAELGVETEESVDEKIRNAISGNNKWVLVGGPPCQAYSIVGRSRVNGIDPDDPRVYLYREYYRILAAHSPPVFVMENVKGLLSATVKEKKIFHQILTDLSDPVKAYTELNGREKPNPDCTVYYIYSFVKKASASDLYGNPEFGVKDFIIKAENFGIPQARHRIILLGIRKDVVSEPDVLKTKEPVNVKKVIEGLPRLRSGISDDDDDEMNWRRALRSILSDGLLNNSDKRILNQIESVIKSINIPRKGRGGEFIECKPGIQYRPKWFIDPRIGGVCNHSTRAHMESDIHRYLYASCYAKIYNRSPKLKDFPTSLLPDHKNVLEAVSDGKFSDRFRVQLYTEPARTVTSHIARDGHYYIHPDPSQCRSLTVREAARIQTFPDNYYFCGPRTAQYVQVGNAVPPLLARQIAEIVYKVLE